MKDLSAVSPIEPRWPVISAILVMFCLLVLLPDRIRLLPHWVLAVVGAVVLVPIVVVGLTAAQARWLRIERAATFFFFVVAGAGTVVNLANLIRAMVQGSVEITGLQLLTSSVAAWITNVLMFSLLYWQIDRGGPEARMDKKGQKPDWLFPHEGAAELVPADWRPVFVDYLFLGFTTATSFSPTDALPLTSRAKLLMMLESMISLVTLVVVAARAINILGS